MENVKIVVSKPKKNQNTKRNTNIIDKIIHLQEIIKRTVLSAQQYKKMDIYNVNELSICIKCLEDLFTTLATLLPPLHNSQPIDNNQYLSKLQEIVTELSNIFRTFGTSSPY